MFIRFLLNNELDIKKTLLLKNILDDSNNLVLNNR